MSRFYLFIQANTGRELKLNHKRFTVHPFQFFTAVILQFNAIKLGRLRYAEKFSPVLKFQVIGRNIIQFWIVFANNMQQGVRLPKHFIDCISLIRI
jgi:hypothetical protein